MIPIRRGNAQTLPYENRLRSLTRVKWLQRRLQKCIHSGRSHHDKQQRDGEADVAELPPRAVTGGDSPLSREEPEAIRKVPRGSHDRDGVESHNPGILEFGLYFGERSGGMS